MGCPRCVCASRQRGGVQADSSASHLATRGVAYARSSAARGAEGLLAGLTGEDGLQALQLAIGVAPATVSGRRRIRVVTWMTRRGCEGYDSGGVAGLVTVRVDHRMGAHALCLRLILLKI